MQIPAVKNDIALIVASKITARKYCPLTQCQLRATSFSAAVIFVRGIVMIECTGHITFFVLLCICTSYTNYFAICIYAR